MAKLKDEFAAASERDRIRYCAFRIQDMSESGKSVRKIRQELKKLGASEETLMNAWDEAEAEGPLPSEAEKAWHLTEKIIRIQTSGGRVVRPEPGEMWEEDQGSPIEDGTIRKIAGRLAYQGFDSEIIYDTIEKLRGCRVFDEF